MLSRLSRPGRRDDRTKPIRYEELVRENGRLRQELVLYKEYRNAFMQFHHQVSNAYHTIQKALQELSQQVDKSEGDLLEHWGVQIGDTGEDDIIHL